MEFPDHVLYDIVNKRFSNYPRQTRIQFGFFVEIAEDSGNPLMAKAMILRELQKCRSAMKPEDLQNVIPLCKDIEAVSPQFADEIKKIREILEKNIAVSDQELIQKQMCCAEQDIATDDELFSALTRILGPTKNPDILKARKKRLGE